MTEQQSEMDRAKEYLAGFGLTATEVTTVNEWEFMNMHGGWTKANPNDPENSARANAAFFRTNRVRSREVTYTEWVES